jgi:hypothetical protein
MKKRFTIYSLGIALTSINATQAQSPSPSANGKAVPVTADNFNRAESDMYFAGRVKESGIGKLFHYREVMPIDKQAVIRVNRDTLYSTGVFDLDAGLVTVTLPDPGKRFMSMQVFEEDQYSPGTFYAPQTLTFQKRRSARVT